MNMREEALKFFREGKLFRFVEDYGHDLTKNDLKDIAKELAMALEMTIKGLDDPILQLVDELKTDWDMHDVEEPFTLNDLLNAERVVYIEKKETK